MRQLNDRFGIGWRPELAASIMVNLDRIDVVEVIIDNYLRAPARILRSLETLARQVPVTYHGTGLGLATSLPVSSERVERLARIFGQLQPESWSEHLAFVRASGIEIGHLAAPPRNQSTLEGTLRNYKTVARAVGLAPALENIATLIEPPGSRMSESEWVGEIGRGTGASLLLDLHNLYANAVNFGRDPFEDVARFPLERVKTVHLSGGHWIKEPPEIASGRRLLDDHVHDVPAIVFDLLAVVAEKSPRPLTVILERDGNYPDFRILLDQLAQARRAVSRGRSKREVAHERASL